MNTKIIGSISEFKIITKFLELDKVILRPLDDSQRYDVVLHDINENTYERVQCKTGRLREGSVRFACKNSTAPYMKQGIKKTYVGQIDSFAVYCPELDLCYKVPIEDVGLLGWFSLRVYPLNNIIEKANRKDIKWANQYLL